MNFAELVALMVVGGDAPDSIRGVVRHWGPEDEEWTQRVWRRARCARRETLDGEVLSVDGDKVGWWRFRDTGEMVVNPRESRSSSPIGGLEPGGERPSFSRWDGTDFTRPTGPVTTTTLFGRDCWHVELAPPSHKPFPIELTVDAATGLVLRAVNPQFGSGTEFTEAEIGLDLPDDLFVWDGEYVEVQQSNAVRERDEREDRDLADRRAWLDAHGIVLELPTRPEPMLHEWDDATGAFVLSFQAFASGTLERRPLDGAGDEGRLDDPHLIEWSDSRWKWALSIDRPIPDEQLALLKVQLAKST